MNQSGTQSDPSGLEGLDPAGTGRVFWNLDTAVLCERAVARGEVRLSTTGALVVTTLRGEQDVRLARVENGAAGTPPAGIAALTRDQFEALKADLLAYVARRTLFGQDVRIAAGPSDQFALRLLSDQAWHALALRHLMVACDPAGGAAAPRLTVLCAPGFHPVEETHGVGGAGVVALDLANGLALVAGTSRSAAIRTALAHLLAAPLAEAGLLPLAGAASVGPVALFVGAPGSGKSTLALGQTDAGLSALDGALGWGEHGLVALEAGRYARPADLAAAPDARQAAQSFGALLENVPLDPARRTVDLVGGEGDARLLLPATGSGAPVLGRPEHLFVLIRDETGVLPALARLAPAQALGPLLSAAAGLPSETDGDRLRACVERDATACWLVNTGRIGDTATPAPEVARVPLAVSRRLVDAARGGELAAGAWRTDPHLGLEVPVAVDGVEAAWLDPAKAWANRGEHAAAARRRAERFAGRAVDQISAEAASVASSGMAVAAE